VLELRFQQKLNKTEGAISYENGSFFVENYFDISCLFTFATKTSVIAAATLSHKKHLLKFRFITLNESEMPEHKSYVEWLIGVETGRLLGDQRHR